MTANIQAIVFDFGGVLLDWDPRYLYHHYFPGDPQAMENFLKEIDFMAWNAEQDMGRPFARGIAEHAERFPHRAHLLQAYFDRWEESIRGPIQGTVEILGELKTEGYPLYGLSNWSIETYPRAKYKYSFFKMFEAVLLSGEVGINKPDPAIFELFLRHIDRKAEECLLIDDTLANINSASNMGFATIHFKSPTQLLADLHTLTVLNPTGQEEIDEPG